MDEIKTWGRSLGIQNCPLSKTVENRKRPQILHNFLIERPLGNPVILQVFIWDHHLKWAFIHDNTVPVIGELSAPCMSAQIRHFSTRHALSVCLTATTTCETASKPVIGIHDLYLWNDICLCRNNIYIYIYRNTSLIRHRPYKWGCLISEAHRSTFQAIFPYQRSV